MADIASLAIADSVDVWAGLGFATHERVSWVSGIRFALGRPGRGVVAWTLRGGAVSELPEGDDPDFEVEATPDHPNGVIALDHIVVATPDLERTTAAFESAGIALLRTREAGTPGRPMTQAFFRLGQTILEIVGPPTTRGPGAASFYGLAFTVDDLDTTASLLGDRLRPAQDAVQSGRRIATVDRAAGSTVAMAFMSPDPRERKGTKRAERDRAGTGPKVVEMRPDR